MTSKTINPDPSISLFVKDILIFEDGAATGNTVLPFFADGYPGLMFQDTRNGLVVRPHDKRMPMLFLYGQTIKPIELVIEGAYQLVIFQLYPFVINSFFNVTAKDINDGCYDLGQTEMGRRIVTQLTESRDCEGRIKMMADYLSALFLAKAETLDFQIRQAIQLIIDHKGQTSIATICAQLHLTERTFERRFVKEVGISPKQFSSIIRFQLSLEQLASRDFTKLTDIVYTNGYADQSHFIKVFKAFTGQTPKTFR